VVGLKDWREPFNLTAAEVLDITAETGDGATSQSRSGGAGQS
jgi:hypothetical protein